MVKCRTLLHIGLLRKTAGTSEKNRDEALRSGLVLYFLTVYIILISLLTIILKTPCKLHEQSLKI